MKAKITSMEDLKKKILPKLKKTYPRIDWGYTNTSEGVFLAIIERESGVTVWSGLVEKKEPGLV